MSNRRTTFFYGILIAFASVAMGMVLASNLGLAPRSFAGPLTVPATNSAPLTGTIDAGTFRNIAKDKNPAVVSISAFSHRAQQQIDMSELFQFPGMQQPRGRGQQRGGGQKELVAAGGSGFIIDKTNGYILTNNHVVEDAEDIEVALFGGAPGEVLKAKVVGRDVLTDSALIQITNMPKTPLSEVTFGDSSQLQPGDWVMAIGSPFSYSNTVTVGVVSAVSRISPELNPVNGRDLEMIQTDAAINHGNSGGPLFNLRGEVVGINTAIISNSESGGNMGIGFAVPINTVKEILKGLEAGKVKRGRIGVQIQTAPITQSDVTDLGLTNTNGAVVGFVTPKGPGDKAGMKLGDVITEFNGKVVTDSKSLIDMVVHTAPGTTVPLRVVRVRKPQSLNVTIEELNVDDEINPSRGGTTQPEPDATPEPKETGFGMTIEPLTAQMSRRLQVPSGRTGVVVSDLDPRGAAAQGGVRPGDVILSINSQSISSSDDAIKVLDQIQPGHTARVIVWRQGLGAEQLFTLRKK
jgi:serine protease Do